MEINTKVNSATPTYKSLIEGKKTVSTAFSAQILGQMDDSANFVDVSFNMRLKKSHIQGLLEIASATADRNIGNMDQWDLDDTYLGEAFGIDRRLRPAIGGYVTLEESRRIDTTKWFSGITEGLEALASIGFITWKVDLEWGRNRLLSIGLFKWYEINLEPAGREFFEQSNKIKNEKAGLLRTGS